MTKIFHLICGILLVLLYLNNANAQTWQPSPGHTQISLWPSGKMPDPLPDTKIESMEIVTHPLIAGKPIIILNDVSKPTMTIYSPKSKNTGAAVVVFPGGGFNGLAIDLEGTEICDWLTSRGMTCILLKYRVPDSGPAWHMDCKCNIHPKAPTALEDAQRTVGLVRFNAKKWHINPHKIGVIGFSAGGYMVADISSHFKNRMYSPIDSADKESCRPDFAIALYPGHMRNQAREFKLNPDINFTKETPPTFLLQAEDDPEDDIDNSLIYYIALKNAGVPAEMHIYAQGGHGFGLRRTNLVITRWQLLVETWLKSIRMI